MCIRDSNRPVARKTDHELIFKLDQSGGLIKPRKTRLLVPLRYHEQWSRNSSTTQECVTHCYLYGNNGAQGRIRTTDTRIFSPLLYQLSYLGFSPCNHAGKASGVIEARSAGVQHRTGAWPGAVSRRFDAAERLPGFFPVRGLRPARQSLLEALSWAPSIDAV